MTLVWKFLAGAVAVGVVLVAGIALWSQNGERRIVAAADQFRVPQDWVVLSQRVQGPRPVGIGDVACPSLTRRWRAPTDMTSSDLSKLITSSGWNLNLENECQPRPGAAFLGRSCSAVGQVDGYRAQLYYKSPSTDSATPTLTLFLQ